MEQSADRVKALESLNALHAHLMDLLVEALDTAVDGISPLEGLRLGIHFAQASATMLAAIKAVSPEVRAQLRLIAPHTRFIYEEPS